MIASKQVGQMEALALIEMIIDHVSLMAGDVLGLLLQGLLAGVVVWMAKHPVSGSERL